MNNIEIKARWIKERHMKRFVMSVDMKLARSAPIVIRMISVEPY